MIGKNWMKAFAFAGASTAVAVAMPAISEARTHYTGKTPADISMMAATSITPPPNTVFVKQSVKPKLHKKVVKTAVTPKHKLHKTIKKTAVKKKTV